MRPKKKVKLQDIAEALGISVVTVSNALAGRKGVSEALRGEIVETAAAMGYAASGRTAKPKTEKKRKETVGLLLAPDAAGHVRPWQSALAGRLEEELKKENMSLRVIRAVREDIAHETIPADALKTAGLIVCGDPGTAYLRQLRLRLGAPIVCCGFFDSHEMLDYVLDDGFHNMGLVYDRLAALGHRDIAIVCGNMDSPEAHDHFLGACFEEALRRKNPEELPVMPDPETCAPERFLTLARDGKATAAVCTDSDTAGALIHMLRAESLRIPEDISVTGYSLDPEGSRSSGISEVIPDFGGLAKQTVKLLMHRMDGKERSGVRLVPGLFIEGSTIGSEKEVRHG